MGSVRGGEEKGGRRKRTGESVSNLPPKQVPSDHFFFLSMTYAQGRAIEVILPDFIVSETEKQTVI